MTAKTKVLNQVTGNGGETNPARAGDKDDLVGAKTKGVGGIETSAASVAAEHESHQGVSEGSVFSAANSTSVGKIWHQHQKNHHSDFINRVVGVTNTSTSSSTTTTMTTTMNLHVIGLYCYSCFVVGFIVVLLRRIKWYKRGKKKTLHDNRNVGGRNDRMFQNKDAIGTDCQQSIEPSHSIMTKGSSNSIRRRLY